MRRRRIPKVVKELDAFPKVASDYQKPTTRGGTLSLLTISIILVLVVSEFFYYRGTETRFKYSVDTDLDSSLLMRLDMTIAMACECLGADVVDLAGDSTSILPHMKMEPALFEMSDTQRQLFQAKRSLLDRFSESESRSLNDFPVIENINSIPLPHDDMVQDPNVKKKSCRIHGDMGVKKVAGNFHITVGQTVKHPHGHAHMDMMVPREMVNFSHRIDTLSFGPPVPGGINPLDSSMKLTDDHHHMFQYFIKIVPTKFSTLERTLNTAQFSVTERNRTINHRRGSHGASGVFFKYDLTAMSVEIEERRRPFGQFLVRLCGVVGGIFATSGMIHSLIGSLMDGVLCRLFRKKASTSSDTHQNTHHTSNHVGGVGDTGMVASVDQNMNR